MKFILFIILPLFSQAHATTLICDLVNDGLKVSIDVDSKACLEGSMNETSELVISDSRGELHSMNVSCDFYQGVQVMNVQGVTRKVPYIDFRFKGSVSHEISVSLNNDARVSYTTKNGKTSVLNLGGDYRRFNLMTDCNTMDFLTRGGFIPTQPTNPKSASK